MRKLAYEYLTIGQPILSTLVPVVGWYEEGAVEGTPAQRPFVIIKFTGRTRLARPVTTMELWAYDDRGSYTRIDDFLRTAKGVLDIMPEQSRVRTDGTVVRLVQADWQGDSADLYDDQFRCNVRHGAWRLIGSGQ